jgi:hypothetical protein
MWRAGHRPPPQTALPHWQAVVARTTHALLYVALIVQPVVGYVGSASSGFAVRVFGWTLPAWIGANAAMKDLMSTAHLVVGWVIAGAVLLHVAAALMHALIHRNHALARMGIGTPVAHDRRTIATSFALRADVDTHSPRSLARASVNRQLRMQEACGFPPSPPGG